MSGSNKAGEVRAQETNNRAIQSLSLLSSPIFFYFLTLGCPRSLRARVLPTLDLRPTLLLPDFKFSPPLRLPP